MAEDVRALLDHLGLGWADILGYSMGARIAAFLALADPERVRSAIIGGLGIRLVEGAGLPEGVAEALEAPSAAEVHDRQSRGYREFAEETGSDLAALAACIRGSRQSLTRVEAARIAVPVLIAVGTKDEIAGSPRSHARGRRQGIQASRAAVPGRAALGSVVEAKKTASPARGAARAEVRSGAPRCAKVRPRAGAPGGDRNMGQVPRPLTVMRVAPGAVYWLW
jgi:pimeloyl-ACP methyl ester carboxylesterase